MGQDSRGEGRLKQENSPNTISGVSPTPQMEVHSDQSDHNAHGASRENPCADGNGNQSFQRFRRNSDGMSILTVNPTAKPPPRFNHENYRRWKEEVSFWREIHAFADDKTSIAELALVSQDLLLSILVTYLRDTRGSKEERDFDSLFKILGAEFQKDSTDRAIQRMTICRNFSRRSKEHIRSYWSRFQKSVTDTRTCGLGITDKMLFVNATQSLSLAESHRMSLLGGLNQNGNPFDLVALKDLSVRLLAPPMKVNSTEDTFLNEPSNESMTGNDDDEQVFLAKGKSRNRPGLGKAATQVASSTMNYHNQTASTKGAKKGGEVCFRCQEKGRCARECHIPAPRQPAFPTYASNKGEGKPVRTALLSESVENTSDQMVSNDGEMNNTNDPTSGEIPSVYPQESDKPTLVEQEYYELQETDDDWMNQRWGHTTFLVGVDVGDPAILPSVVRDNRAYFTDRLRRRVPMVGPIQTAIVDIGARWSIVWALG